MVGWDEILEGGLAPNAVVMSWRGVQGGIEAARSGHDVIMTPTSHTYFDYYQVRGGTGEPLAIGGFLPLDSVYNYEPVPAELEPEFRKHILGAQAQLWTEYMADGKHVEYMAFPRLSALSEVVWSPRELRDLPGFRSRLSRHLQRLDALNVNYRRPD
jgi:hexosaminidase